jgi:hypothetical protein
MWIANLAYATVNTTLMLLRLRASPAFADAGAPNAAKPRLRP